MTQTSTVVHYNDAHLSGWLYVNAIRLVPVRRGGEYFSCDVSVVQGTRDAPEYLRINSAKVVGEQAVAMVCALNERWPSLNMDDPIWSQRDRVRARFKLSDLQIREYVNREQQTRFNLSGRLFSLRNVYINRDRVFAELDDSVDSLSNPTPSTTQSPDSSATQALINNAAASLVKPL